MSQENLPTTPQPMPSPPPPPAPQPAAQAPVAPAPSAPPAAAPTLTEPNLYDLAEAAWLGLIAAADRLQSVANRMKKTARSVDGYGIEKALIKHRPDLMKRHLENLKAHRKEHGL